MSDFVVLGDYISIKKGKPPLLIPYFGNGAEIYLSPEYLRSNSDGIAAKASSDSVRVSNGDTVLLWDGSNAGEFFKAKNGLVASTMARIGHSTKFRPAFFFHLMKNSEQILKNQTNGTGIPHVDKEILEAIQVFCPSESEQNAIAQILDTLDTTIRQTEAIIAKLQQVKQGLLHDLLTRGIDANGQLRPPVEQAPHLYKESPLGWIPREWEVTGLKEKAPPLRSILRTGPFGSSLKGEHWCDTGRPVVTIGSLGTGKFIEEELLYVSEEKAHALSDFQLITGDIVFSRVADVGRSVVIEEKQSGWIMSSNFMRISININQVNPYFLQQILTFDSRIKAQIRSNVNSGGRDVANSAVIMGLSFVWPTLNEQDEILRRANINDKRTSKEEENLAKLKSLKSALMDDLLTGRVRVTALLSGEKPASKELKGKST